MTFPEFAAARLPTLLRYAAVLTGDRELAQDVVQEVMLRAHAQWSRIGRLDAPEQYVRRMIVNEFLSWRRRWGRQVPVGEVTPSPEPGAAPDAATTQADRDALLTDLRRLPRRQQAVLMLRYYEGLSCQAELLTRTGGSQVSRKYEVWEPLQRRQGARVRGCTLRPYACLRASWGGFRRDPGAAARQGQAVQPTPKFPLPLR